MASISSRPRYVINGLVVRFDGIAITRLAMAMFSGSRTATMSQSGARVFSFVEWIADHVPEKVMGVFGVGLILIGFTLLSVQYWAALLDMSIRS